MKAIHVVKIPVRYHGFTAKSGFLVLAGESKGLCFSSGWHQTHADGTVECFVYRLNGRGQWVGDWEVVDNYYPEDGEEYLVQWDEERLEGNKWVHASFGEELVFAPNHDDARRSVLAYLANKVHGVIRHNGTAVYYHDIDEDGDIILCRYIL